MALKSLTLQTLEAAENVQAPEQQDTQQSAGAVPGFEQSLGGNSGGGGADVMSFD